MSGPREPGLYGGEGRLDAADIGATALGDVGLAATAAAELAEQAVDVGGIAFVGHRAEGAGGSDVRSIALDVRGRLQDRPAVVVVIGTGGGKPSAVVAITKAAQDLGIAANQLIDLVGTHIGGRGGGKADVAQGGGTDVGGIEAALTAVQARLARS